MSLKKLLRRKNQAQSALEYILLTAISVIAILGLSFVFNLRDNALRNHFNQVSSYIGG